MVTILYANKLEDIKNAGVLKAGVKHDYEPFGFKDTDGNIVGFDIDLLKYISKKLGVKLQTQRVTSKTRIPLVEDGTIDIAAASMTHKVSRDANIDFSISYFFDGQTILTRQTIRAKKVRGFMGKKVGAIKGSTSGENLKKFVPTVRLKYFDNYDEALEELKTGALDGLTTDSVWCITKAKHNPELKVIDDKISFEPYGMGVPENESDFRDAINFALQDAVKDGTYEKLYKKWFNTIPKRIPEVWP
jgi:polar amino acid transport system substrate-binding protein